MINRKLKATLSLVLALIVMCSACVVPVFAVTGSGGGSASDIVSLNDDNISEFINSTYRSAMKQHFGSADFAYITSWRYRNGSYDYSLLVFDKKYIGEVISNDVSEIYFGSATVFAINDNSYIINNAFNSVSPFNNQSNIRDPDGFFYSWFNDSDTHIVAANCSIENLFDMTINPNYNASITYDEDSKRFMFDFEPRKSDEVYNVNIAVSNQSEWDYPNSDGWYYLPMDTSGDFTKEKPLHGSIPLNFVRDGIMRYNSNKDIEDTGKLYFFLIAAKGKGDEALYKDRFCAASYEYSLVDTVDSHKKEPFDEKKDYDKFPSLSDYIDTDFPDIRDYVNFDMFHDLDGIADFVKAVVEFLWNAFTGFFRWLWAALKFIFFNFLGIFEWLGKCLWTIVKNIGIALYNLVVDLKKLVTYLFIPNSKDLNVAIESKFPAYAKLRKAFQQGKQSSSNSVTFTLFGKDFDFNMNSAPNELKSALFNASTIAMYAICIYATIKALFRCFGIQLHESSESEGE